MSPFSCFEALNADTNKMFDHILEVASLIEVDLEELRLEALPPRCEENEVVGNINRMVLKPLLAILERFLQHMLKILGQKTIE